MNFVNYVLYLSNVSKTNRLIYLQGITVHLVHSIGQQIQIKKVSQGRVTVKLKNNILDEPFELNDSTFCFTPNKTRKYCRYMHTA